MALTSNLPLPSNFWEKASDVFRKRAKMRPQRGQEAAFKSGMNKLGSSIANKDYAGFEQINRELSEGYAKKHT